MNNCISYFSIQNAEDEKIYDKCFKRQQCEDIRKRRIFNPKTRLIGIDVVALQKQLEEKHRLKLDEQVIDEKFGQYLKSNDKIAEILEIEERNERRKLAKEINLFREHYQRPQDRREYDLNDPDRLKKDLPCRISDADPRCGISSCQKFEGEDLIETTNVQIKNEQFKSWLDQQVAEKQARAKELEQADNEYTNCLIARDHRAVELENLELCCRKKLQLAFHKYNTALGREKQYEKERYRKEEQEDNLAEIYNNLISDMLTENPDVAMSNLGPGRMIGFMYKGMNEHQLQEYRIEQEQQRKEKKIQKEQEKIFEDDWTKVTNAFGTMVDLMDAKQAKDRKKIELELAEENIKMGKDQRENMNYLNKIVYKNKLTAAYYENFNKTAR